MVLALTQSDASSQVCFLQRDVIDIPDRLPGHSECKGHKPRATFDENEKRRLSGYNTDETGIFSPAASHKTDKRRHPICRMSPFVFYITLF